MFHGEAARCSLGAAMKFIVRLTLSAVLFAGCYPAFWFPVVVAGAIVAVAIVSSAPPPPPREEAVPQGPPGYVWQPGFWYLQHDQWVWVQGRWVPAQPGYAWVPPHWYQRHDGSWQFAPGHWQAMQ